MSRDIGNVGWLLLWVHVESSLSDHVRCCRGQVPGRDRPLLWRERCAVFDEECGVRVSQAVRQGAFGWCPAGSVEPASNDIADDAAGARSPVASDDEPPPEEGSPSLS